MKSSIIFIAIAFACIFQACTTCQKPIPEPCGNNPDKPLVDLVVMIDQSGSMNTAANSLSAAINLALDAALDSCDTDLRVVFLGLEGTNLAPTLFTQTHRDYLEAIHGTGIILAGDTSHVGLAQEQGANAIEDLTHLFDWRADACRSVFYISDEELDSISPPNDFANEDLVTARAIQAANDNAVTVFAHFIDHQKKDPRIKKNYEDLTSETGGRLLYTSAGNVQPDLYIDFMPEIVCNACRACELNSGL